MIKTILVWRVILTGKIIAIAIEKKRVRRKKEWIGSMEIKFKSENGLCPYFIYKEIKFYIQDKRSSSGDYVYFLCSKKIGVESVTSFETDTECKVYVQRLKNIRYVGSSWGVDLYTDILRDYIVKDKTVTVRQSYRPLSGEYSSYVECLEFSKKYIAEHIKLNEAEQLSLF